MMLPRILLTDHKQLLISMMQRNTQPDGTVMSPTTLLMMPYWKVCTDHVGTIDSSWPILQGGLGPNPT
jgi:hypothetical protein